MRGNANVWSINHYWSLIVGRTTMSPVKYLHFFRVLLTCLFMARVLSEESKWKKSGKFHALSSKIGMSGITFFTFCCSGLGRLGLFSLLYFIFLYRVNVYLYLLHYYIQIIQAWRSVKLAHIKLTVIPKEGCFPWINSIKVLL